LVTIKSSTDKVGGEDLTNQNMVDQEVDEEEEYELIVCQKSVQDSGSFRKAPLFGNKVKGPEVQGVNEATRTTAVVREDKLGLPTTKSTIVP
jgi:hypothetical protein